MIPANLIRKKRDGGELSHEEWAFLIRGYCQNEISDAQMAAMAMAVCLRGMTPAETADLTDRMVNSGRRLERVSDRPRVDKHSTGGLGDKVSLILAPLLAVCDVDVPMISGRGLGRTGGTLDKLESIPGFQTHLDESEASRILRELGCIIVGADKSIAPADRKLYALRDITATVESIGLITGSILSKKLAASLDALVMDVKVGSAAFMTTRQAAHELALSLIRVGTDCGMPTDALLTDMDQPLGRAVGNALEVDESIQVLQGSGPEDVRELTVALAAQLLVRVNMESSVNDATVKLHSHLDSGRAYERFESWVAAQGGRLNADRPLASQHHWAAKEDGYVASIDCPSIADTVIEMGGGRKFASDRIDPSVGVEVHHRVGDRVTAGQTLLSWYGPPESGRHLQSACRIVSEPISKRPLILDTLLMDKLESHG
ncbi:MAG: thymidine phosphorylase [Planctomycetota bacterium]